VNARLSGYAIAVTLTVITPAIALSQAATRSPHGALSSNIDCPACHTATAWRPVRQNLDFRHDRDTKYVLTGRHASLSCARCHLNLRFDEPTAPAAATCAYCHFDVHRGNLPAPCRTCHNTTSFRDVEGLARHARTDFPLTGAHTAIVCEACHMHDVGGHFTPIARDCIACHGADYRSAQTIDHVAGGFSTVCTDCHSTITWSGGVRFDHLGASGFALVGAHASLRCGSCHLPGGGLKYTPTSETDCVACHRNDYNRAHEAGFPTACAECHNVYTWEGAEDR